MERGVRRLSVMHSYIARGYENENHFHLFVGP